jgi:nitrite reductase/ring-hydroxylating ferredoxin subunit
MSVSCPMHDWRFNVTNGQMVGNPVLAIQTFPISIAEGEIWVEI